MPTGVRRSGGAGSTLCATHNATSAIAPPATLATDLDAKLVRGEVEFGPAFEGAPGIVHGGFVAALLDEALGMATIFSGGPGMTGELTTRFRWTAQGKETFASPNYDRPIGFRCAKDL